MNIYIRLVVILNSQDMMSYLEINALCSFYGQCSSNSGNVLFLRISRMRSFSTEYTHQPIFVQTLAIYNVSTIKGEVMYNIFIIYTV